MYVTTAILIMEKNIKNVIIILLNFYELKNIGDGIMNEDLIIETERLILRQYKLSDVNDVVDGLNNLNISKWLAFVPYPYTKEDAIEYIRIKKK